MHVTAHIWIDQPLHRVYQTAANHNLDRTWRQGVTDIRQSHPGTVQVGTCLRETLQLMGRTLHTDYTVIHVQEGMRHDFVGTRGDLPISGSRSFQASMQRTRVTLELHLRPPEGWERLSGLLKLLLEHRMKQDLRRLKTLIEHPEKTLQTPSYT